MCLRCEALLKSINTFLIKADDDLEETLKDEGYEASKETVSEINKIEADIAETLLDETAYILKQAEDAEDLTDFLNNIWPEVKDKDKVAEQLAKIFVKHFKTFVPEIADGYIRHIDAEMKLVRVSEKTTAWIDEWSEQLANIMKLDGQTQIENILRKGLEDGDSMADFTRKIQDSGIRNEYYRARQTAVTEVLTAHRAGQQEAFIQSPAVESKRWLHTGIYATAPRLNHIDMTGQTVPKNGTFTLQGIKGGEHHPSFPGDPVLPPEERISCHCIAQPVVNEDILGMSLEERQLLQQQALDEMDETWRAEVEDRNKAMVGFID